MRIRSIITLLLITAICFAQTKRANNWAFGMQGGISFASGTAVAAPLTAIHAQNENSSVVSDEFGNLLFYTSGDTVWDKSHTPMPNGIGLTGNRSSSQGVLVAPVVGACNKYYVFTSMAAEQLANPPGLRYTIVDMSLQGNGTAPCPLGDVDVANKNVHLTAAPLRDSLDEKVTSVMHTNGIDYWVIVRELSSNTYYSFLVTSAGVNPVPVISNTGGSGFAGYMKPSKDGKQIVSARLTVLGGGVGFVELIDFNATTGVLSNAQTINNAINNAYYGVSFSCNDSLIYVTSFFPSPIQYQIIQYQRYAPTVATTETVVATSAAQESIQLGPDGKIYHFGIGQTSLSVLTNPNSIVAPGYVAGAVALTPGAESKLGSPNLFHGYERTFCTTTITSKVQTICQGDSTLIGEPDYGDCHIYTWTPSIGLSSPTSYNPMASPSTSTTYTVNVTTVNCESFTDTFRVEVQSKPSASVSGDLDICAGDNTTLSAGGVAPSYSWSSGATTANITVSPTSNTTYTLIASNQGCNDTAIATVTISPLPDVSIIGSNKLCRGDSLVLNSLLNNFDDFLWSTGSTNDSISITPSATATYTLTATNNCGSVSDTLTVAVNDLPILTCPNDDTLCLGAGLNLNVGGANSYIWTPAIGLSSSTGSTVAAIPSAATNYSVTGEDINGCKSSCSFVIDVFPLPLVDAGVGGTIAIGESVMLSANAGASGTYNWLPANSLSCSTCVSPIATPTTTTTYYVNFIDDNGCSAIDSLEVIVDIECDAEVFIPNVFSPNGDGNNDLFKTYGNSACFGYYKLSIFNRWGELVYESSDPSGEWDGSYRGKGLNTGVFVYRLNYITILNEEFSRTGNVTLLK